MNALKTTLTYAIVALAGAGVILIGAIAGAMAEDTSTSIALDSITGIFMPYLLEAAYALIAAAVGWLLVQWTKLTGLSIEEKHRDALQTALVNAVNFGLNGLEDRASKLSIDVKSAVLATAIDYVLKSVPDAVKFFGLTPERLGELLQAKLLVFAPTEITDLSASEKLGGSA